jgi:hypothetical protein
VAVEGWRYVRVLPKLRVDGLENHEAQHGDRKMGGSGRGTEIPTNNRVSLICVTERSIG